MCAVRPGSLTYRPCSNGYRADPGRVPGRRAGASAPLLVDLLGVSFEQRTDEEGSGWQTHGAGPQVGVHERGRGSGDTVSLPYFAVADLDKALERVKELGGSIIHPAPSGPSGETPKGARSDSR